MEVVLLYQSVTAPNQYFYHYKDAVAEYGKGEPCTLLAFKTDDSGTPLVNEKPVYTCGFFHREATKAEVKYFLSKALQSYREPEGPTPGQIEQERYRDSLWEALWDEFTPR